MKQPCTIPGSSPIITTGHHHHCHRWTAGSPERRRQAGRALRWHHPLPTTTGPALGEGQQEATGRLERVLGLFHTEDGLPRAPVQPLH